MNKIYKNKNGFTLIELVIVIAVIAILAGVLVPTFSNIIEKANASNDINLIRNINEVLVINSADKEVPQTKDEFRNVINEYGIKDFKNKSKNHIFYYLKEDNISIIWGIKEQRIIYPEYYNYSGSNIEDEINLSINIVTNLVDSAIEYQYKYCNKYKDNHRIGLYDIEMYAVDYVATGAIKINYQVGQPFTIYISGGTFDGKSFSAINIFNDNFEEKTQSNQLGLNIEEGTYLGFGLTLYQISSQYYKIVCTDVNEFDNFANYGDKYVDVYFTISLLGKGKDLVITLNEEIY